MAQHPHGTHGGSAVNTLAQTGTDTQTTQPAIIISGRGTDMGGNPKSRAKRKMVGQVMAINLAAIAKKEGDEDGRQSYWNTYHCQKRLYEFEGRYYGRYCKNRFCPLCCSIRKARIINEYMPVIRQWENPYFVTLTVKAHPAKDLPRLCKKLLKAFQLITQKYRKRAQRGIGPKLIGVRSLECNFNPVRKTYNPHLHIIVATREMADILVGEWKALWGKKLTYWKCMHMRPVKDLERDLIETAKYGTKIFTDPDIQERSTSKTSRKVYAAAFRNIIKAFKGSRIFDRFGFNLPPSPKIAQGARMVTEYKEWEYLSEFFDWHHVENELVLTGHHPTPELNNLLRYEIDRENQ